METNDDEAQPSAGRLLTNVPGRSQSRSQAQQGFEEGVAELRRRYKPAFWPLFIPEAKDMYRWRARLECGCVHELYTRGKDRYPDEGSTLDPVTRCRLPPGEYWCATDHETPKPYREIVEWVERDIKEFPPDPEEPKYEGIDAETWAKMRHPEPYSRAFWRVKLSCGHFDEHVVTDVDWEPDDGPRQVSKKRLGEIRRDFEELWAEEGADAARTEGTLERGHVRRMLDLGWPRPEPERECYTCTHAQRITGYQRIGWLIPRTKPKSASTRDAERNKLMTQLANAEAEIQRLRKKLDDSGT